MRWRDELIIFWPVLIPGTGLIVLSVIAIVAAVMGVSL